MKSKLDISLILTIILFSTSCNNDFLEKYPKDGPSDVTFLQTEAELIMAINGAYKNLWFHDISATGQWEYVLDCTTDISWDRNENDFKVVGNGSHSSTTAMFELIWRHLYSSIARTNFILANIDRVNDAPQETIDQADGQARFLRAYWYSHLITLWGDVPLVTQILGIEENKTPRANKADIEDFLISELEIAAQKLPETWGANDRGRATKGAALALLSRIALNAGRYDVAASAANQVMDSNVYQLYPNYRNLFTYAGESNSEAIFEIAFKYGIRHHRMPISLGSRTAQGNSTKVPTQSMVDSYECIDGKTIDESPLYDPAHPFDNRDPRLKQTIAVPGDIFLGFLFESNKDSIQTWNYNVTPPRRVPNQDALNPFATFTGYLWKKMADEKDFPLDRNSSSLNFIILRLGEVLLNYAEAKIESNQIDQDCLDAINAIRGRGSVNMPPIPSGKTQIEMRNIIRRERKIELAMEGLRLQDIRRWEIADKVMPGPLYGRPILPYSYSDLGTPDIDNNGKPDYTPFANKLRVVEVRTFSAPRDYLWPIPQSEMDVNDQLVQNTGY